MKAKRQAKILEIIHNSDISTQEELLEHLIASGYRVTQATISRDIREMRLIKVMDGSGTYKYTIVQKDDEDIASKFNSLFSELAISADHACNIVVVKCLSGTGMSACAAVDSLRRIDIVGTIAGDDTFICIMKNENMAIELTNQLKKLLQ